MFALLTFFAVIIGIWIYEDIKEERINDINYTSSVIKRYYELSFNQWRNSLLSLGQQLIEIETKIAYQEDTIQALNDVVCQQQKQIEQLELSCKMLVERFGALSESVSSSKPADEVPPHY